MLKLQLLLFILPVLLHAQTTILRNSDFATGTYIMDKPGLYLLGEDISFEPNPVSATVAPADAGRILNSQLSKNGGKYDSDAYALGFFAAIAVVGQDITIDLNGYTMEQSLAHSILQRFYANIELADQPFIPNQGPAKFGPTIVSAKNVTIRNGTLGRSSHHGLHGNGNANILLENLTFKDYEVAAAALNGVKGLTIRNCVAKGQLSNIPTVGTFSALRFIYPFVQALVDYNSNITLRVQGKNLTATDILNAMKVDQQVVYEDLVVNKRPTIDSVAHPDQYALYQNKNGRIDGSSYGFLVNRLGVATVGFVSTMKPTLPLSEDVLFENLIVQNCIGEINEIPILNRGAAGVDAVGASFQLWNVHPTTGAPITVTELNNETAEFKGSVLANAQAIVAKGQALGEFDRPGGINSSLQGYGGHVGIKQIDMPVINWIEALPGTPQAKISVLDGFLCNGDSMFHVAKGMVAFRIDGAMNVTIRNCHATTVENHGSGGHQICNYNKTTFSNKDANNPGYGGATARGFSFAGSTDVMVSDCSVTGLRSSAGPVIGFDVQTTSKSITLTRCRVDTAAAPGAITPPADPTPEPVAFGFLSSAASSDVDFDGWCAANLTASEVHEVLIQGTSSVQSGGEADCSPKLPTTGSVSSAGSTTGDSVSSVGSVTPTILLLAFLSYVAFTIY